MSTGWRGVVILVLLLGVCAGLALVILDRSPPTLPPIGDAASPPGPSAKLVLPEVREPTLDELSEALDRPLFSRSRTPPANAPAPTPTGPNQLEATLAGVLTTGAEKVALLLSAGSVRAERLREGDVFQGWEVIRIEDDFVVFERDGRTEMLTLNFTGDAPAPH
jgi:hypothetical protein